MHGINPLEHKGRESLKMEDQLQGPLSLKIWKKLLHYFLLRIRLQNKLATYSQ